MAPVQFPNQISALTISKVVKKTASSNCKKGFTLFFVSQSNTALLLINLCHIAIIATIISDNTQPSTDLSAGSGKYIANADNEYKSATAVNICPWFKDVEKLYRRPIASNNIPSTAQAIPQ